MNELDLHDTLDGQLKDFLDICRRYRVAAGSAYSLLQSIVLGRVGLDYRIPVAAGHAGGLENLVQLTSDSSRAGDHGGHLLFLDHFPGNKLLNVRVIQIETDHLGRAPGGAARFDSPGGTIADTQKRHQPG